MAYSIFTYSLWCFFLGTHKNKNNKQFTNKNALQIVTKSKYCELNQRKINKVQSVKISIYKGFHSNFFKPITSIDI